MIIERMKRNEYRNVSANYCFWRTYDQKGIDLIEKTAGKLYGYEFKWRENRKKPPQEWLKTYANAICEVVTPDSHLDSVT